MERKASPPLEERVSEKYFIAVRMLKFYSNRKEVERDEKRSKNKKENATKARERERDVELTTSLQSPLGAPPHLSTVIWNIPCSPPPPTAEGLQVDSCMANEATTETETNQSDEVSSISTRSLFFLSSKEETHGWEGC